RILRVVPRPAQVRVGAALGLRPGRRAHGRLDRGDRAHPRMHSVPPHVAQNLSVTAEVGVYVHVPFCRKRCPYCAFVLIESDGALHERFVDKICREVAAASTEARTLYFGGGTPSLLSADQIGRIIVSAKGEPDEITVECNPE